ncbi:AEC family transporter [Oceanobacillus alkalisoli]|uniref:AEC family transporter n=1 Tax=Oceanobacillus alkalisoli TaxID=2925113 RepID=UPI001F11A998|nr:AEC family transporter [Oceanobacillus alkalisoli]MCF3944435.1 AEC family transporter [Oceanobacillus alkalisoli]
MALFIQVIIPIMLVFLAGFILQRLRPMSVRSVSAVTIYILSPALVFITLYDTDFDSGYLVIIIYMLVLFAIMVILNKILGKIFKWPDKTESAAILATGFMNSGNYGLPVVLFSVGTVALPYAVFIMVIQGLMNNFFGIYYASRGRDGMKTAFLNVMKMPTTYAAILGIAFQYLDVPVSESIHSMLSMVGEASIPVMMIVLGMQLGSLTSLRLNWQVIISSVTLKMVGAPIIAYLFVVLFNIDPLVGVVLIIISAMPTAATTTMYAIEFDSEPELVSSMTFIATIVSIISVSVVLNLLQL